MSIIKTLNSISKSKDLAWEIYCHYKGEKKVSKRQQINNQEFMKVCMANHIDLYPVILLDFFDLINIKIGIFPVEGTEFWSARTHYDGNIVILNHYISRVEAVLGGIHKAISIYETNNLYEKRHGE